MTTKEQLKAKIKEMNALCANINSLRKENPLQYNKEGYKLQMQYNALSREMDKLSQKIYLESCKCQKCEDSGWAMKCCDDKDCQSNVICYDCDAHLSFTEEE